MDILKPKLGYLILTRNVLSLFPTHDKDEILRFQEHLIPPPQQGTRLAASIVD